MSFLSMNFLLFLAVAAAGYYVIPGRLQWMWLLLFSYLFYISFGVSAIAFILATTVTTFLGGLYMERIDKKLSCSLEAAQSGPALSAQEKKSRKAAAKLRKKQIAALVLIINFGILAVLKYRNFAVENINSIFGTDFTAARLLLPLGISFYTFQSMGYLIDVYRGKYAPDHSLPRFALFVSFFPQILQGPIGRYDRLSDQLFASRRFDLTRIERGLQLMLWGYFKKIVIADRAAVVVSEVFGNYESYTGFIIIAAVLCYSIQLYGDFSGGMDVVMGAAQLFGVSLDANFKRPYFARSISDFWHRWHITLGTWMKDYVFYSFSLSKPMNHFGKYCKKHFSKHVSRVLPVCLANLLVFFLVGVWHGPAWKFIAYGLYNGIIIAVSNLFAPVFQKTAMKLHIPTESKSWAVVQILRTFLLVNISWYFDMAKSLTAALIMMRSTFRGLTLAVFADGSFLRLGLDKKDYLVLALSCAVLFTVSFMQERQIQIRESLAVRPLAVRWCAYLLLLFSMPLLGQINLTGGGFIYAQF